MLGHADIEVGIKRLPSLIPKEAARSNDAKSQSCHSGWERASVMVGSNISTGSALECNAGEDKGDSISLPEAEVSEGDLDVLAE